MNRGRKILSLSFKLGLGFACAYIIYRRLNQELGIEQLAFLKSTLSENDSIAWLLAGVLLIAVNWGLEARKWQLITKTVEPVSYGTAMRSVYSGVCAGNFAPGRATEFLGKILFFSDANKGKISVLHFANGMVQLSITLLSGLLALMFQLDAFEAEYTWLSSFLMISSLVLLLVFAVAVWQLNFFLNLLARLFPKFSSPSTQSLYFPASLWIKLILLSALRYLTFTFQFCLLLHVFSPQVGFFELLPGIALYFMLTSLVPMVSFLEAAIRTAIALLVLNHSGLHPAVLALATVALWLLNIVIPSLIGYFVLLKMKFDFKLIYKQKP